MRPLGGRQPQLPLLYVRARLWHTKAAAAAAALQAQCYCPRVSVPLDTTPEAALLHEQSYRELGLAGRFKIALELSDFTHALATAGIRQRHPEYTDEDARRELAEVLFGRIEATR